ncbi:2OG-Fe(II) oxygenase family protein [Ramlibacter sp. 2FC]|uniref:2OG-Fe(II) oxygenase family protein n=1 Tax=Ramlibacter sp. 2FC TaxID=2502188 RepID=UPI001BB1510E|nr:2OG-Fe(II) oxygenase family protein [Ramlibacter sp. 2FC]
MSDAGDKWMETSDVISMFPTLVWKIQLQAALHQPLDARILALLAQMRAEAERPAQAHTWQSGHDLHRCEELRELQACVLKAGRGVLRALRIGQDELVVTGCWANVLGPGAAHRMHSHPNNFLSGVYYLRTQAGADTINFHDPRPQARVIRPPVTELTSANTDQVVVKVADGTLLLFPSYLEHSVDANQSKGERVSISFNLMFPSFTEQLSQPLW